MDASPKSRRFENCQGFVEAVEHGKSVISTLQNLNVNCLSLSCRVYARQQIRTIRLFNFDVFQCSVHPMPCPKPDDLRPRGRKSQVASRSRLEPAGVDPHLCGRSLRFRGAASDMWPENWSLNSKVRSPKNTGAFINRRWCCRKCSKGETIHHHVENNLL